MSDKKPELFPHQQKAIDFLKERSDRSKRVPLDLVLTSGQTFVNVDQNLKRLTGLDVMILKPNASVLDSAFVMHPNEPEGAVQVKFEKVKEKTESDVPEFDMILSEHHFKGTPLGHYLLYSGSCTTGMSQFNKIPTADSHFDTEGSNWHGTVTGRLSYAEPVEHFLSDLISNKPKHENTGDNTVINCDFSDLERRMLNQHTPPDWYRMCGHGVPLDPNWYYSGEHGVPAEPEWQRLRVVLQNSINCIHESNNWFKLWDVEVYIRAGMSYIKQVPHVRITSIEASKPGTGQFKRMILVLEKVVKNLGYAELRFECIQNADFNGMLGQHGYVVAGDPFTGGGEAVKTFAGE